MAKALGRKPGEPRVSLKTLAEYLQLSPATVSFVLNDAPNRSIPEATRERVRAAAKKFNYQPSLIARSLQGKRTHTIGILLPELGEGYHAQVLSGAADVLMCEKFFFFTAHHRHHPDLVRQYPNMLHARGVEGLIFIDTHVEVEPPCPAVTVAGHKPVNGVSNVVLDHHRAADLAVSHLYQRGHRKIAFMRGPRFSSDSDTRWRATLAAARRLGITISRELTILLNEHLNTPELGYPGMRDLLSRRRDFTAVLCFNDVSAIGCVRALHEAGLNVPQDVSVVGFDDIAAAAFQVPSLTTIRQPLQEMGATAALTLLKKISNHATDEVIRVEPQLIERESTACAASPLRTQRQSHESKAERV